jgi:hypothetical protein
MLKDGKGFVKERAKHWLAGPCIVPIWVFPGKYLMSGYQII